MNGNIAQQDARRRIAVVNGCLAGLMALLQGSAVLSFYYGRRDAVGPGLQGRGRVMWAPYAAWEVR